MESVQAAEGVLGRDAVFPDNCKRKIGTGRDWRMKIRRDKALFDLKSFLVKRGMTLTEANG